jgi:flagellin-like hook-associated protein FlgL
VTNLADLTDAYTTLSGARGDLISGNTFQEAQNARQKVLDLEPVDFFDSAAVAAYEAALNVYKTTLKAYYAAYDGYRTALSVYRTAVSNYMPESAYLFNTVGATINSYLTYSFTVNSRCNTVQGIIDDLDRHINMVQNYVSGEGGENLFGVLGINVPENPADPRYDPKGTDLYTVNLLTHESAAAALENIRAALNEVSIMRGEIGAGMNRLQSAVSVMQTQAINTTAAESRIRDANMAEEITNLTRHQFLAQTGVAALAHSNNYSQMVLGLLK